MATVDLITQLGGELITYTPAGGVAKQIIALVERDRHPREVQESNGQRFSANTRTILIANHATDGVTTVQEHKDKVRFKKNTYDSAETDFTVQTVLTDDTGLAGGGGAFYLLVQA